MPLSDLIAVIPASGKGGRFGQPKALASYEGKAFAEHITSTLLESGVDNVIVAVGYDTPDMLATLRQAIDEQGNTAAKGYLVWPVDHPFVRKDTVLNLIQAWREQPVAVIRPSHGGQSGHPIIIPAWLDLNADDGGQGLAGLIRAQACTVIDVPVEDPNVLRNINYPKDLEN
ncbi:MAG: NTP transferase domain-containing protein [Candidatus Syntrophosphaera sp.]|nr:NTP transferase domain-containing protein [Candidatus Syntrophosphaera sp.]